jgi:hypothetical protein
LKDLPWYVQFSLYLHTLKESSSSSSPSLDRTPWLESLPKSFDTPIHWTEAQRQEWLQYNAMVRSVARQETMWKTNYDTAKTAFAGLTWNDFLWGCETARSRAFSGSKAGKFNTGIYAFTLLLVAIYVGLGVGTLEEAANGAGVVLSATILKDFVLPKLFKKKVYVICPVIDMANHNSVTCNAQVALEYFQNVYSLATTGPVAKHQAVEISYGSAFPGWGTPRSNAILVASIILGDTMSFLVGRNGIWSPDAIIRLEREEFCLLVGLEAVSNRNCIFGTTRRQNLDFFTTHVIAMGRSHDSITGCR